MSSWKSLRSRCACGRKCCNRTNDERRRWRRWKKCEVSQSFHRIEGPIDAANADGALQLRDNILRRRKLRPSWHRLEQVFGLPELREAARPQEPFAASWLSPGRLLESGRLLRPVRPFA